MLSTRPVFVYLFTLFLLITTFNSCFILADTLTAKEKSSFISLHNTLRRSSKIKPTPKPAIPHVTWNEKLAKVARNYLKGCVFAHNAKRSTQYGSAIGENIYIESGHTTGSAIERGINSWFNEHVNYKYKSNTCASGKVCGHYTQLIWAKSTQIGCAKQTCSSVKGFKGVAGKPVILVLCNYAGAGNFVGQKPYKV